MSVGSGPAHSDLCPSLSSVSGAELAPSIRQPTRSLLGPYNPKERPPQQSHGHQEPKEPLGAEAPESGEGPSGAPLPGCALTTHRAPSWSPGRRSRASVASSLASQTREGLRPPHPASFKPKAAISTDTLNSPSHRKS